MTEIDELTSDLSPPARLPGLSEVGATRDWVLPLGDAFTGPYEILHVRARLLGVGSSRRAVHDRHDPLEPPEPDARCGACRWFESRILREVLTESGSGGTGRHVEWDAPGQFLVHFAGRSAVPGEVVRGRVEWSASPLEVIELLTTRPPGRPPFLTKPAARCLAQAAQQDDDLREAYLDRAVS